MPTPRAARVGFLALALAALALVTFLALSGTTDPIVQEQATLLRARSAALRNAMDLSRDGRRFLVLDPSRGTLTLYLGATPLRAFPVLSVGAGERRLRVGRGTAREDWRTARWEESRLEPEVHRERRTIVSDSVEAPDLTGAVDWVPLPPEEAIPTPPRFVIHFAGGLGMEVVAAGVDSTAAHVGLWQRMRHTARGFLPSNLDRYRIRVVMAADDAGDLYRSLPDSAAFVAVIPQ